MNFFDASSICFHFQSPSRSGEWLAFSPRISTVELAAGMTGSGNDDDDDDDDDEDEDGGGGGGCGIGVGEEGRMSVWRRISFSSSSSSVERCASDSDSDSDEESDEDEDLGTCDDSDYATMWWTDINISEISDEQEKDE